MAFGPFWPIGTFGDPALEEILFFGGEIGGLQGHGLFYTFGKGALAVGGEGHGVEETFFGLTGDDEFSAAPIRRRRAGCSRD